MSDPTINRLYELLPRVIRLGDVTHGDGALLALLSVLDRQRQRIDDDIGQLYDDLFIETCDDSIVEHLGAIIAAPDGATRAEVANTLSYWRRPGLLTTIEQVARDITGCAVQAAEPIPSRDGTPERPGIELTVHLTDSYPIADAPARRVKQGCFTFHPLGVETQLFADPSLPDACEPGGFIPLELRRDQDVAEIIRHITIVADGRLIPRSGDDGEGEVQIDLVDLGRWRRPRSPKRIHLDPERGRISFPSLKEPAEVRVHYAYGARVDVGGGPYPRFVPTGEANVVRLPDADLDGAAESPTLAGILDDWTVDRPASTAVRISDDSRHALNDPETTKRSLQLEAGGTWAIVAEPGVRPWLVGDLHVLGPEREVGRLILDGVMIEGSVTVGHNVELVVRHCTLRPPPYGSRPHRPAIELSGVAPGPSVHIESSIVGPLRVQLTAGTVVLADSIVDRSRSAAIAGPGDGEVPAAVTVRIERSTVLGVVRSTNADIVDSVVPDPATGVFPIDGDNGAPKADYGHPHYGTTDWSTIVDLDGCATVAAQPGVWQANPKLRGLVRLCRVNDHVPLDTEVSVRLV